MDTFMWQISPKGVVANILSGDIGVSEFKRQSLSYVNFQTFPFLKAWTHSSLSYDLSSPTIILLPG